jgi:hypothetical protein
VGELASPTPTNWPPPCAFLPDGRLVPRRANYNTQFCMDLVGANPGYAITLARHIAGARVVRHADGALFASDALARATLARMSPPWQSRSLGVTGAERVTLGSNVLHSRRRASCPDSDSCYDHAHVSSLQSTSSRQSFPDCQGGRLPNIIRRAKCRIWPGRAHAEAPSFEFPFYIHAPGVTASVLTQMVKTCVALYSCPER